MFLFFVAQSVSKNCFPNWLMYYTLRRVHLTNMILQLG